MGDPHEKLEDEQSPIDPPAKTPEVEDDNFEETQRIDEEGNELDPEDIK